MSIETSIKDLELLIRSHYGVIFIDTLESERADTILALLADRIGIPYFRWTRTKGLRRIDTDTKGPVYGTESLESVLAHIEASTLQALYHMESVTDAIQDKTTATQLTDAMKQLEKGEGAIVVTGSDPYVPDTLRARSAVYTLPEPAEEEYRKLLAHLVRDLKSRQGVSVQMKQDDLNRLLANIKGLTLTEAEKILTKVIIEDGVLSSEDVRRVVEAKQEIVEREGVLEYYPVEESMADIADLEGLKRWLAKRSQIITEPRRAREFGLEFPKGVLLLGVPGCGKSLSAKAVAMEWGLPLLRLDPAKLYNKYIGESEKNFRRAMETAERMSPVVLWIDEIEKAFSSAGGAEDGGVSTRIFGTFLSWLQERNGDVFIVATANDVTKLPPEFLRKGRFDEIFFIDLPVAGARRSIFEIHLSKRGKDPALFDLDVLVQLTEGFSGSEIEQVVVSGLYTAFSENTELTTEILKKEVGLTSPLSETMAEKISQLRSWARERTTSAQ